MLSIAEFCTFIHEVLELDAPPEPDANLVDDLGFDSIRLYEMLVAVEDLGVEVDEVEWTQAISLNECYRLYCVAASHPNGMRESAVAT
jgi:acyl carrier protein